MATIKRNASAHWSGTGKEGKGTITTQSGALSDTPYGFSKRFGDEKGTNPEELIGAAHAGCFTMALAFQLTGAGKPAEKPCAVKARLLQALRRACQRRLPIILMEARQDCEAT